MKRKLLAMMLIAANVTLAACSSETKGDIPVDDSTQSASESTTVEETAGASSTREEAQEEVEVSTVNENEVTQVDSEVTEEETKVELDSNIQKSAYIADKLYDTLGKSENVLFSPMSLNMAVGMASNGATDTTQKLLYDYLGTDDYNLKASEIVDNYFTEVGGKAVTEECYEDMVSWFKAYGLDDEKSENLATQVMRNEISGYGKDLPDYYDELIEFTDSLYEVDREDFDNQISNIRIKISNSSMNGTSQFTVANSVWVNKDRQLVPDFQKAMDSYYKAYFDNIDVDKPESSADKINDWVSDNTAGLIDNIVTPDNITSDTSAVLVNAIYFNSNWNEDWVVKQDGSFTDFNGNKKSIESITNSVERYYENNKARAFGMGYKNGFTFVGILPKEEGEFNIQDLDIEGLLKNDKTDECTEIIAEMPKLKYETSNNVIKSAFMDMGMSEMFGPSAHFENLVKIGPDEYTCISDIIQKCTIDLDEYGTEASAATASMFVTSELAYDAREPVIQEVILDRPFAFLIYESETGEIAFMGKVNNVE